MNECQKLLSVAQMIIFTTHAVITFELGSCDLGEACSRDLVKAAFSQIQ